MGDVYEKSVFLYKTALEGNQELQELLCKVCSLGGRKCDISEQMLARFEAMRMSKCLTDLRDDFHFTCMQLKAEVSLLSAVGLAEQVEKVYQEWRAKWCAKLDAIV